MTDHTDLEAVESVARPWEAYDDEVAATGFFAMARRLPSLCGKVLREAWSVSRWDTLAMVALTLVAEIFTAVGLLATTGVLEELLTSGPTPDRVRAAAPSLILVVGSLVARAVLREGAGWARARLEPQLNRIARTRLLELTTQVELVAFDDGPFHDKLHRVRERAVFAASWLLQDTLTLLSGVIGLIAVAGVLTVLHPVLLPLLLLAVVPAWWVAVRAARMRFQVYAGMSRATRRMETLADLMAERASAAEVRAYTMRSFLLTEFVRLARYEQAIDLRLERKLMISRMIGDGLGGLGTGLVFVALGLLLFNEAMPLAVAGTAVVAIRTATGTLSMLAGTVNRAYENGLFYQDYLEFQEEATARLERQGGAPPPAELDRISVRDVTFTYPAAEEPALRGISIDIQPGEIIALVGENGSGKTTLAKVISGLYAPEKGTVSYGGTPLEQLDLARLREQIAVIAQDFTHWPFSARQNITIGRHDHPDSAVQLAQAAEASGADAVFERLPRGYDTLLDPSYAGGTELSGGQWQRIAVARGLYRDAPLLICDEPTAALDARTEHAIFETIRRHAAQRTVVLITHRLASVRYADRIYVLDKGLVAEHGTHKELMAADGIYAEFYSLQAQAYAA